MVSIRLWDLPTRLFHWTLLVFVGVSFATGWSGGNAMAWHGRSGIVIIGLLSFRCAWGLVGSSHARFAGFVRGPAVILEYLRGRWQGVGHNPLGALSVLAMLGLLGCQALGGLFANDDIAYNGPYYAAVSKALSDAISGWHKRGSVLLLAMIALHVGAILFYVGVRKETLIMPMLTGRKAVADELAGESASGGSRMALAGSLLVGLAAAWLASGAALSPQSSVTPHLPPGVGQPAPEQARPAPSTPSTPSTNW